MKKWSFILSLALAFTMLFSTAAFAFDDLPEGPDRAKIASLQERGIISGINGSFMGQKALTNAEGVHLLVKGFDLSLAAFLFMKEPLASDYFDRVPNDAWYAPSFVIAGANKLPLPRSIDPSAHMTREEFAHDLLSTLLLKGDYSFTKMLYHVADESEVHPDYRHSLQLLLNAKIVELDRDGKFHPTKAITRRDAAVMLYNTLEFAKAQDGVNADSQVELAVSPVNGDVNRITLSWGEKPNAGYTLAITGIVFKDDQTAEIRYKLGTPIPGHMYAQVITHPKAEAYLAAGYKAVPVEEK